MATQPRRFRPGFTLVEVLMVIVLISVLMSIGVGIGALAQQQGRMMVSQTNLFQIGMLVEQYAEDHRGYAPPLVFDVSSDDPPLVNVVERTRAESGLSYFDQKLFVDPSDREPTFMPVLGDDGVIESWPISYGYNIEPLVQDVSLRRIDNPDRTILFYDGSMSPESMGGPIPENFEYTGADAWLDATFDPRKRRTANVLFLDGRVLAIDQIETDWMEVKLK